MRSFEIYGIWPQADIHITSANAVTLVWDSLRLAPTSAGLAQARPNYHEECVYMEIVVAYILSIASAACV